MQESWGPYGGSAQVQLPPQPDPLRLDTIPRASLATRNGLLWLMDCDAPRTGADRASASMSATDIGPSARTWRRKLIASSLWVGSDGSLRASSAVSSMCWVPQQMREVSISSPVSL